MVVSIRKNINNFSFLTLVKSYDMILHMKHESNIIISNAKSNDRIKSLQNNLYLITSYNVPTFCILLDIEVSSVISGFDRV